MNTNILELPIVIDKVALRKERRVIDADTTELVEKLTSEKRFGIADLWSIRKNARGFSIYGMSI